MHAGKGTIEDCHALPKTSNGTSPAIIQVYNLRPLHSLLANNGSDYISMRTDSSSGRGVVVMQYSSGGTMLLCFLDDHGNICEWVQFSVSIGLGQLDKGAASP